MTSAQIEGFLGEVFPQIFPKTGGAFAIAAVSDRKATITFTASADHLRPGGTVSGPAMMTLADLAMYVVLLAHIGPVELAVTTSLNINFLKKPPPGLLQGQARLLKLGRVLAVGDVIISTPTDPGTALAHASVTYSIPPKIR